MSHVCHITTSHQPHDTRIFKRQCCKLAQAGYRVTLIAPSAQEEHVGGVHILPIRKHHNLLDRAYSLPREAVALAEGLNADLYHFHDPELIPPMQQLAGRLDRPIIWDAHEVWYKTLSAYNSLKIKPVSALSARLFDVMEINACRQFAAVVTVSSVMAQRYRSKGFDTTVIANTPDISGLPTTPPPRSAVPRLIGSGGQFAKRGVYQLVDGFIGARRSMHCELGLWGRFKPTNLKQILERRMISSGVPTSDLLMGGPYPWKDLMELVATAWAGTVLYPKNTPYLSVGLPNRLFEYWAMGVPVITTAGSQAAAITQREGAGLIVDTRPESLTEAFLKLARDPDKAATMGRAGARAVKTKYNWDNTFRRLAGLYADLGVSPRTPAASDTPPLGAACVGP